MKIFGFHLAAFIVVFMVLRPIRPVLAEGFWLNLSVVNVSVVVGVLVVVVIFVKYLYLPYLRKDIEFFKSLKSR